MEIAVSMIVIKSRKLLITGHDAGYLLIFNTT